jgi:hypothetical protein
VSSGRRAIGLLLPVLLAAGAAGCNVFGTKLTPGLEACVAVPQSVCDEIVEGRVNNRAPVELTAYRITCKSETCTEAAGEAEYVLNWADGQSETATYTWVG